MCSVLVMRERKKFGNLLSDRRNPAQSSMCVIQCLGENIVSRYAVAVLIFFVMAVVPVFAQEETQTPQPVDPYIVETEFFPLAVIVGDEVFVFGQETWQTPNDGGGSTPRYFSAVFTLENYLFYRNQADVAIHELQFNPANLVSEVENELLALHDSTYYYTQFTGGFGRGELAEGWDITPHSGVMLFVSNSWTDAQIVHSAPEHIANPCTGMTYQDVRERLEQKKAERAGSMSPFDYMEYPYNWPEEGDLALNWIDSTTNMNILVAEYPVAGCAVIANNYSLGYPLVHANLFFYGEPHAVSPDITEFYWPDYLVTIFGTGIYPLQPTPTPNN